MSNLYENPLKKIISKKIAHYFQLMISTRKEKTTSNRDGLNLRLTNKKKGYLTK